MLLNSLNVLILTAILNFTQASVYYTNSARTVEPSNQCGFQTTSLEGTITNPERNYYSTVSCVWNITVPVENLIHLNITRFQFPGSIGSCSNGWLAINGIAAENNTEINLKLCGSQGFPRTISVRNYLNIEYYSYRNTEAYFTLVYHAVPVNISEETEKWISKSEETLLSDKESLPRALPALRLFDETYFKKSNLAGYKFKTQYLLKLSADLLRNSTKALSAADLSHHVLALLAICSNPRSFHGIDLVQHLRNVVDRYPNSTKPFDLLTLCNAGVNLTSDDIKMLSVMLDADKRNVYMLDFQAITTLTFMCAKGQNKDLSVDEKLQKAVDALTSYQKKDGSFGSLRSTVLITQALSAAGAQERSWNKTSALRFIQSKNHTDGSFGNIYDMYAVLPVLSGKTLLDINSQNCDFLPDGVTPLQEVKDKMTKHISLTYQLWVGDGADVKHTIALKFPNGTNFFDVMRLAAENNDKFNLKWTSMKNDLYVYEIAGYINDPTSGNYWNLYVYDHSKELVLFEEGLENYIPSDGETAVMWYKTVNLVNLLQ